MKKFVFLILALGMFSISVTAQTKKQNTTRRTTTRSTRQSGQVMKFRQVANDGYVWYKLKRGNLYGVRDADGNNIIPIKYDGGVVYHCFESEGSHYFLVKSGDFWGAYTRQGTLIVSPARKYTSLFLSGKNGKICWVAQKNGKDIILDAKGNEIFSLDCEIISMSSDEGVSYFHIRKNGKDGICDLNGNVICPPEYNGCWLKDNGKTLVRFGHPDKTINYSANTRYDYSPYEDLYYAYTASYSSSSSSSTPSSSNTTISGSTSNNSNSNNTGGGTTTIVVEHQHTPQPVQEWQTCIGCGGMGTMGCDNCGGSGTKYIGDRLHRCSRCNGQGIIPCNICYGRKGQYVTVYR